MNKSFNVEIISPEKSLLKEKVSSTTLPAFEGEMTILSNHIPIITFLRPGIIKVFGDTEKQYFVEEGTVEFSNNTLIILSSTIISLDKIKAEDISKMIETSKNQLTKDKLSDKAKYIETHKIETLLKINQ